MVLVRDTEQLADHQRRQRERECLDQVDRPGPGQHPVDQVVGHPLDGRAHGLDTFDGERTGDHPADARVVGVVHVEEGRRVLGGGLPEGLVQVGEARPGGVDAEARVAVQGPLVLVAGDEPVHAAVPQPDPGDRLLGVQSHHRRGRSERTPGHPAARGIGKSGTASSCVSAGVWVMTLLGGGKEAEDIEPREPDNSPSDG